MSEQQSFFQFDDTGHSSANPSSGQEESPAVPTWQLLSHYSEELRGLPLNQRVQVVLKHAPKAKLEGLLYLEDIQRQEWGRRPTVLLRIKNQVFAHHEIESLLVV